MSAQQINQYDRAARIARVRNAMRALSALSFSENAPEECLIGKRGDLADLLEILSEELTDAIEEE
ncbi:MAG TPA: hypothetical protein VMV97_03100 [Sulfuriferula sp.]|nr:hypothetical protein [Sulfuriferula sp.]